MFIPSARRAATAVLTCLVFVSILLTGYRLDSGGRHDILNSPRLVHNENATTGSQFAYAQYATSLDYLCNAVINFNRLEHFGAKHDKVVIFPEAWTEGKSREAKAMRRLHADYPSIVLKPFDYLRISKTKASATWADSLNKFHAFELTDYKRVLIFDSDTQVLNNMDHLFQQPKAAVAVPRAYWLNEKDTPPAEQVLSSHVMLLEPNATTHDVLVQESLRTGKLDMDVVNTMFRDTAMILPHRRLALLTGEFRGGDHQKYLAPEDATEWDPVAEVSSAYLVHFSDWPMPKPWLERTEEQWEAALPKCDAEEVEMVGRPKCADRLMWSRFYEDYNDDKKRYCNRLG